MFTVVYKLCDKRKNAEENSDNSRKVTIRDTQILEEFLSDRLIVSPSVVRNIFQKSKKKNKAKSGEEEKKK